MKSRHSRDDYDDHEPINPKSEDESVFGMLYNACCGPCYRWYSRQSHQKLVNTLQQSEHDDDWGLGRDSSGTIRLSPKQARELTSFDHRRSGDHSNSNHSPSHLATVTSDDTPSKRQNRHKQGHNATAAPSSSSSALERPSHQLFHDTDVLLAVSGGRGGHDGDDDDEDGDITLARTVRPSFSATGGTGQKTSSRQRDESEMGDDDYMASPHQSHHGMSSYFRSTSEDSEDSLEKEMEKQLKGGAGGGRSEAATVPNAHAISRSRLEKQRDEQEYILSSGQLSVSLDEDDDMAVL